MRIFVFYMELTDTHSHIYDEAFDEDREAVVQRALDEGVDRLILPGISSKEHLAMTTCADQYPDIAFPCIGLHPTEVEENWQEEMRFVRDNLHSRRFYGIGEIGLDYYWSRDFEKEQKRVFAEQIEIAAEEDLPILIHSRNATDAIFEVLEDFKNCDIKGIFHAFSGSYETYCQCLKYGDFKFGIGGVCTYKKAGIAEVVPRMSLSDLVLETDCPWLTPVPHRGTRNESSYIKIIAEKVAQLRGIGLEAVAEATTATARTLFGI